MTTFETEPQACPTAIEVAQAHWETTTHNAPETQAIAARLGENLFLGAVILLRGVLGAGKTCFVQGLARGLGVRQAVTSPTFTLINEYLTDYASPPVLYHIDLYRVESFEEVAELGLEDYFARDGVCVVEWGEKLGQLAPAEHLEVNMDYAADEARSMRFVARGERYTRLLDLLANRGGK